MPDISYSFGAVEESTSCKVISANGKNDQNNTECLQQVQKFLTDNDSENPKVIYITHGFQDGGGWLSSLSYNLFKRYGKKALVVAKVYWKAGANARSMNPHYPELSTATEKEFPYCKSSTCQALGCCVIGNFIPYGTSSVNTWPIGNVVGYVHNEIKKNTNILTYCIGFSLGAHVCGFFGKMTRALNQDTPIQKIIGLDPAGPMWEYPDHDPELRLNRNDAKTVEIFHTNTIHQGFENAIGHIDLYINGGALQPNCPKWQIWQIMADICNHKFALKLLNHILNNENKPCYAKWKCDTISGADLLEIKQENSDQLQKAKCKEMLGIDSKLKVGDLDEASRDDYEYGVFWIQVDENSETCKMDT